MCIRDRCARENLDPVGVHTGDSIVAAPALTLADKEYQTLRSAALRIISALGVEGGCNCQFALDPESFRYAVIEVNPRVSRSSALASKATGYPIARAAARIAVGMRLDEIRNEITGKTSACFEPALDYVVVKFPKWPFDKFLYANRKLGTQMKATGEVMAIGRSFEQAFMKAVRGAEISLDTPHLAKLERMTADELKAKILAQDDERVFAVYEALSRGVTIGELHRLTKIDEWFLAKLWNLASMERRLREDKLTPEQMCIRDRRRAGNRSPAPVHNHESSLFWTDRPPRCAVPAQRLHTAAASHRRCPCGSRPLPGVPRCNAPHDARFQKKDSFLPYQDNAY